MGVNLAALPRMTIEGIEGGVVAAYRGTITLQIGRFSLPPIPCAFTELERAPLLLGREGFFDLFNICLDNRRRKTVLHRLF